jgi:hypothetical protein
MSTTAKTTHPALSCIPPDCTADWNDMVDTAWQVLRKENHTIPSHALDAMRQILKSANAPASHGNDLGHRNKISVPFSIS